MKYFFAILLLSSFLGAEIPFQHALGLLSATKNSNIKIPNQKEPINLKDISPFWGMVALHSGLMEQIRFYGNYDKNTTKDGREIEEGKDVIARLIKRLFNSPDGVSLTATAYNNDPVGNLSRNLSAINDIIEALITTGKDKSSIIYNILNNIDDNISNKNKEFAELLVAAYKQEYKFDKLYPKNITIISLLAFVTKVANHKKDLEVLSFLIGKRIDLPVFTAHDYDKYKNIIKNTSLSSEQLPQLDENQERNQELAFLMFKGFDYYEMPWAKPDSFHNNTIYLEEIFSDCGETSLKNLFGTLASAYNEGVISLKILVDNLKSSNTDVDLASHERFNKMLAYFERFSEIYLLSSDEAHNEWAKVVSGINTYDHHLSQVIYSNIYYPLLCELKSQQHDKIKGIMNMFNLIAKLIPDNILNQPWSEEPIIRLGQIRQKLNHLLMLFSHKNAQYDWKTGDNSKNITDEFPHIIININNNIDHHIYWLFDVGHFDLYTKSNTNALSDDWRRIYASERINFSNQYMAFLYLGKLGALSIKYPLTTLYHHKLKNIDDRIEIISFILNYHEHFYLSLLGIWINKLTLNNDKLKKMMNIDENNIIYLAVKSGDITTLKRVLDYYDKNKINYKELFRQKTYNPLLLAITNHRIDIVDLLVSKNPDISINPIMDIVKKEKDVVLLLSSKGFVLSLFRFAVMLDKDPNMDLLRFLTNKKLVDIDIINGYNIRGGRFTALAHAVITNNLPMAELLLKHGADTSRFFYNQAGTALEYAEDADNQEMIDLLTKYSKNIK